MVAVTAVTPCCRDAYPWSVSATEPAERKERAVIMKICKTIVVAVALSAAACSSDDNETADGAPEAPMLMEVEPMEGALHLMWMNMQNDCSSVEAERKMASGAYEPAFSVPGSIDNKMDAAATENMTYTYRLRCKKGSAFSAYSNELSGNPYDM
jgi:hypothetical protein